MNEMIRLCMVQDIIQEETHLRKPGNTEIHFWDGKASSAVQCSFHLGPVQVYLFVESSFQIIGCLDLWLGKGKLALPV